MTSLPRLWSVKKKSKGIYYNSISSTGVKSSFIKARGEKKVFKDSWRNARDLPKGFQTH